MITEYFCNSLINFPVKGSTGVSKKVNKAQRPNCQASKINQNEVSILSLLKLNKAKAFEDCFTFGP